MDGRWRGGFGKGFCSSSILYDVDSFCIMITTTCNMKPRYKHAKYRSLYIRFGNF
jgi:hypothetical protein